MNVLGFRKLYLNVYLNNNEIYPINQDSIF